MKVIVILLALGLVVVALGFTGQLTTWTTDSHGVVHGHCWSGCGSGPKRWTTVVTGNVLPDSPEIQDVVSIHESELSTEADEANLRVYDLLDRAVEMGGRPGGDLVRQELPPLAATITGAMPTLRERLLSLRLKTVNGESCRTAVLRMLARTQSLYRTISSELAASLSPANIVDHVVSGEQATTRSF